VLRKGAAAARYLAAVLSAESRCEGQHAAGMVKVLISSCTELDLQYLPPFQSLPQTVKFGALTSESLLHAVSRPRDGEEWRYSTGYITEEMIRERLFPAGADVMCGLCGPPAMINAACLPNLKVHFCNSSGPPPCTVGQHPRLRATAAGAARTEYPSSSYPSSCAVVGSP